MTNNQHIQRPARRLGKGYESISRELLQNEEISEEARGFMARLLSYPDNYRLDVDAMVAKSKHAKRDKTYRIIRELVAAGYIINRKKSRGADGRWVWSDYIICEEPHRAQAAEGAPHTGLPDTAQPYTEKPQIKDKIDSFKIKDASPDKSGGVIVDEPPIEAVEPEPEAEPIAARGKRTRKPNPYFDAVAKDLFALSRDADIEANAARIGMIAGYLRKRDEAAECIPDFIKDYVKHNPGLSLPLNLGKFAKYFAEYERRRPQAQPQVHAPRPQAPAPQQHGKFVDSMGLEL